jgi:hypothetical protein
MSLYDGKRGREKNNREIKFSKSIIKIRKNLSNFDGKGFNDITLERI